MNEKKANLGSNLKQVDAHIILAKEYDEIPEITDADISRSTWKIGDKVVAQEEGRAEFRRLLRKQKINITLDPDVLSYYREKAGGRGYQTLINATLREAMRGQQIAETLRQVIREELHS